MLVWGQLIQTLRLQSTTTTAAAATTTTMLVKRCAHDTQDEKQWAEWIAADDGQWGVSGLRREQMICSLEGGGKREGGRRLGWRGD